MNSGIYSTIEYLRARLCHRWVSKWQEAFRAPETGGFYERLGKGFKPVSTGQRRLLTQCRQLAIYSHHASLGNSDLKRDLEVVFEFIVDRYHEPKTGQWIFSLDDQGKTFDRTCDLYAVSFVIFAFCHYFRATGDSRAKTLARDALVMVSERFRYPNKPGFAEALDADGMVLPKTRRQNPHMHLLEACLFAHETWQDPAYAAMADEMVGLFYDYFYDEPANRLGEFFTDALAPHPEQGHLLEPGHYFEWVWLLKRHARLKGNPALHDAAAFNLLDFANRFGWDSEHGGIYDTVDADGRPIQETKRIWPFCEALKANALMLDDAPDRQAIKDRVADMVDVFLNKYMDQRGFWVEWLNRDLTPAADYMPGTTPYHVYFGIMETWDILKSRGPSKSVFSGVMAHLYGLRRSLSQSVRRIRTALAS